MRDAQRELRATGGEVVLVGLGKPEDGARFKRELDLPFRMLVDPPREAYKAAGLIVGSNRQVLGPEAVLHAPSALLKGGGLRRPRQNWHQLGGTLVMAPGGELTYRQVSRRPGDDAPPDRVTAELRKAAERAGTRA